MKRFRIFRPGKHTASCGTATEFTKEDLAKAVTSYNAQLYAAPLVIGHPKVEDRAYGQVAKLTQDEAGDVWAEPTQVEPTFSALVQEGGYPNRSVSWYMPDHPNNPVPGVLYPKHIGFLGAVPPALKGLGAIEFREGHAFDFGEDDTGKVVEFASASDDAWNLADMLSSTARLFRGLRDWMLAEKGAETADQLLPSWNIEGLERQALRQEEKARNTQDNVLPFNEPGNPAPTVTPEPDHDPEEIAAMKAENDRQKAQLASFNERETAIAAAERMATVAAIDATLDPLVKAGKVLPAARKALANFMADLPDGDAARTIEFGEAPEGQPAPKVSPRAFMAAFLGNLPKSVDFSDRSTQAGTPGALTPRQLADKATALRDQAAKEGRTMSFSEATNRVLEEAGVTVEDSSATPQV